MPPTTDSTDHGAVSNVNVNGENLEDPSEEVACFGCGRQILEQSTFMYGDHEFCTEKCRGKQISVDRKLQQTASMATSKDKPSLMRDTCSKYRMEAEFLPAKVTTFDGTRLMQNIGIRTILVRIARGSERKDLVDFVTAGLARWERGHRKYIVPVLMLFKTESTLELMPCNLEEEVSSDIYDIEIAPILMLRGKKSFKSKEALKKQLEQFDVNSEKYLDTTALKESWAQKNTCQGACVIS